MELCIVCLESNDDTFSRINIQSSEWKECNIQRIIEKHLWWWCLMKPNTNDTLEWLCRQCWQEISSFHNYYLTVEKAHKHFQTMMNSLGIKEKTGEMKVKLECVENNNGSLLTEDLMQLKRHRKGRQLKLNEIENLPIEEINIVDVKSEVNFKRIDNEDKVNGPCADIESSTKYETDSLNLANEHLMDNDFHDYADCYQVAASDNEDKIIPLIQDTKTKRKQKTNIKKGVNKKTKSNVGKTKTKKVIKKVISNPALTKIIKENDEFLSEGQHKLVCSICNVNLEDFRCLKVHFRNEHNIRGYAMCCSKKFYKRCLLIDHINVHKNPEYFKCQLCDKSFELRRCLEIHKKTHLNRERNFHCEECGKSFFALNVFDRHKLSHVPENERNFPCNHCDKKFASKYLQRQHEYTHNKNYFKICDVCGKSFRDNFSFLRHIDEHAGVIPSCETCNICGIKLTNKYALTQHIKMRHTEENLQEQTCPYCSRVSPNINAHRKHIKYSHTMERKYACHMCDKSFRRPVELKEHLSTHTGEPLYTCPHCPKTFISNANMHKHRKIAHRVEWEEGRLKKFNEPRRKGKTNNIMLDSISNSVTKPPII